MFAPERQVRTPRGRALRVRWRGGCQALDGEPVQEQSVAECHEGPGRRHGVGDADGDHNPLGPLLELAALPPQRLAKLRIVRKFEEEGVARAGARGEPPGLQFGHGAQALDQLVDSRARRHRGRLESARSRSAIQSTTPPSTPDGCGNQFEVDPGGRPARSSTRAWVNARTPSAPSSSTAASSPRSRVAAGIDTPSKEEVLEFINETERSVRTYLYGRKIYQMMIGWVTDPSVAAQSPKSAEFARIWQRADKVVFSSTLQEVSTERTRIKAVSTSRRSERSRRASIMTWL